MGIGMIPLKSFRSPTSVRGEFERAGISTPHSQLRQLSLGSLVARSLKSLPHALSEQFADPTYAQDLEGSSSLCTNNSYWKWSELEVRKTAIELDLVMHKHARPHTLGIS